MIEGHGDDLYRYGAKVMHNFSTNIISDSDHSGLISYLHSVMSKIGSYPEPAPYSLERQIARKIGVRAENVVVTNGATDAMYRIAHIFSGCVSAIRIPAFREYQDACRSFGHEICFVKEVADIPVSADLAWLCSPNNPTGEVLDKSLILDLSDKFRGGKVQADTNNDNRAWVVVDQAYADYTAKPVLAPQEAVETGNVVLLSSLTKRYAVPGLRIGYMVAESGIAAAVRDKGMPWAVNTLAIEAGAYLLRHDADYIINARRLHAEALRIACAFRGMGIECSATDCNFILCRLPEGTAAELKEYLVDSHGILVRDASNFEGLDERYFRVAAQSSAKNDMLIKAVEEWMR